MGYRFSVEKFKENFNAKDITDKSIDSVRITHACKSRYMG